MYVYIYAPFFGFEVKVVSGLISALTLVWELIKYLFCLEMSANCEGFQLFPLVEYFEDNNLVQPCLNTLPPPLPLHTVYPYRIHKVRICLILGKLLRAPMPIAHLFFGLCHIVYITHVIYAICLWGLFLGVPLITFGRSGA